MPQKYIGFTAFSKVNRGNNTYTLKTGIPLSLHPGQCCVVLQHYVRYFSVLMALGRSAPRYTILPVESVATK